MRFFSYETMGGPGLGVVLPGDGGHRGCNWNDSAYPGDLMTLLAAGEDALDTAFTALSSGTILESSAITFLLPLRQPGKIICAGLNFADHSTESGFEQPNYPTLFGRFTSSLVAHGAPLVRPRVSEKFDFEGEIVAIIGRGGRHIPEKSALDHVAGYALFNDASVRDYQFKSPQWTMGKNFDGTGAFGPYFVTADELPPGCTGLQLQTRLNGQLVQDASTDDLVFSVATLVSLISVGITLQPGDLIVTGTPAGVGAARKPPLWMKPGDICQVQVEGIGTLSNPIVDEKELC